MDTNKINKNIKFITTINVAILAVLTPVPILPFAHLGCEFLPLCEQWYTHAQLVLSYHFFRTMLWTNLMVPVFALLGPLVSSSSISWEMAARSIFASRAEHAD